MKQQTLESILLASLFALILAVFPGRAQADDPFTTKFQNAPDEGEGPSAGGKQGGTGPEVYRGRGEKDRQGNFTPEERERMKSIQEKLGKEPDVQAAREAVKNAPSPEERHQAMKNMKEVMDKHLSAEDRQFMDKIRKQHMKNHGQGGGPQTHGRQGPPQGKEGPKEEGGPTTGAGGPRGVDGLFGPGGPQGQERGGPGADGGSKGEGKSGPEGGQPPGSGPDFGDGSHQQGGSQGVGPREGPGGEHRPMLTDEQRQRFKSIRDKYKDDPEVKACREAVKDAVTPEERELAIEEYRAAIQKKMSPEDRAFFDDLRKNRMQDRPTQIPPSRQ